MSSTEKSIEINVPVSAAYNQWTQFEDFPKFMEGIQEVKQLDDTHLHWKASIGGKDKEWDAEITEQTPDTRIAWRSTTGTRNDGIVTFHKVDENTTRVIVHMDYEPEGMVESAGDAVGVLGSRVQGDLERFKEFLESRGHETGAWRGSVHGGQTDQSSTRH
jgi:uncharacterized membrane protein